MPQNVPQLQRTLGSFDVTLLGVGAIIGGGIFASIGTAAVGSAQQPGAGPSLILSVLLTALVCLITALCYSELAACMPTAGSAYAYTRAAFGTRTGWLVGWCLCLEYAIANVAVAISWGEHAGAFLQPWLPPWLQSMSTALPVNRLLAASLVLVLSGALARGTRGSAHLNNFLVLFKIAVLIFFVVLGASSLHGTPFLAHWQPFFPHGWRGTLYGSAVIFFAFIGFDAVASLAEEVRVPQRSLPRGICASLALCALLYMAVAAVLTGIAPLPQLAARLASGASQPLSSAVALLGARFAWAAPCLSLGALVAQTTALLAFQVAQARILFAMARDGLLPRCFCRIHPRHQTPAIATWIAGYAVALGSLVGRLDAMLDLTDIGTLSIFCVTNAAVSCLRWRQPQALRPFRVPGGAWLLPGLGIAACLTLMLCLPAAAWFGFAVWLSLGWLLYAWIKPTQAARTAAND